MKKIFLLILLIASVHIANAQLLNKIKQKAKEVAEEAVTGSGNKATPSTQNNSNSTSVSANGINNKINKEVANKPQNIIFSKQPFAPNATTGTDKDFTTADNIYARLLLPATVKEVFDKDDEEDKAIGISVALIWIKNNVARGEYNYTYVPASKFNDKFIDLDVLPAKEKANTIYFMGPLISPISRALTSFGDAYGSQIPFGDSQEFTLQVEPNKLGLQGTFNFTVADKKDLKVLQAKIEETNNSINAAITANTQLPEIFSKPSAKNSDPQLSLANLKKMLDAPDFKVIKAVIEENGTADYSIQKNELDIPEYKFTARPLWIVYKNEKGECFFTRYYFRREYLGGGKYSALSIATTTADHTPIPCENVK